MGSESLYDFKSTKKISELGYAMTGLIILFPLIFSALLFFYIISANIKVQSHLNDICRTESVQVFKALQTELNGLMSLNPMIKAIKFIKYATQFLIAIVSISAPVLLPQLSHILSTAKKIEEIIVKIQDGLIALMNKTIRLGNLAIKSHLYFIFWKYRFKLLNFLILSNFNLRYEKTPEVAIEKVNPKKYLSEYKLKNEFERSQKLFFSWSFYSSLGVKYNSVIKNKINQISFYNSHLKSQCITTLEEKYPWNPIPIKVKL